MCKVKLFYNVCFQCVKWYFSTMRVFNVSNVTFLHCVFSMCKMWLFSTVCYQMIQIILGRAIKLGLPSNFPQHCTLHFIVQPLSSSSLFHHSYIFNIIECIYHALAWYVLLLILQTPRTCNRSDTLQSNTLQTKQRKSAKLASHHNFEPSSLFSLHGHGLEVSRGV